MITTKISITEFRFFDDDGELADGTITMVRCNMGDDIIRYYVNTDAVGVDSEVFDSYNDAMDHYVEMVRQAIDGQI